MYDHFALNILFSCSNVVEFHEIFKTTIFFFAFFTLYIVSLPWDSQFKDESTERFRRVSETLKSTISNIYPDEISRKILVTVVKLNPVLASADDGGGGGSSLQKTLVIVDISLLNDETNIDEGLDQMKSILESKMEANGFESANPNWWRLLAYPGIR